MLNWCNRFNICCFLDNHNYHLSHHSEECIAAAGTLDFISCSAGTAFEELYRFSKKHQDWLFGHFSYDLKNEIENLSSSHPDHIGFPDLFFFVPQVVMRLSASSISIGIFDDDHEHIWQQIQQMSHEISKPAKTSYVDSRYSKESYLNTVREIQQHILRGDCYEVNLCQEFFSRDTLIDPVDFYYNLGQYSPNPYAAFYKLNELYLLCLSPERFLKKEGNRILSQPIKGTAQRDLSNAAADEQNALTLARSEKERAENIMVVDLVRNDLSKIALQGSVHVDELCAIYSFPQVHQMISTISGELTADTRWTDVIRAAFPMGSMTGAPKKRVMELIEQYELSKRGLFSGSVGYVTPDLDFDFNVVIRSVLYNRTSLYLSFHTGSAITFNSDPELEYEECLLKAAAIKKALAETNTFH